MSAQWTADGETRRREPGLGWRDLHRADWSRTPGL